MSHSRFQRPRYFSSAPWPRIATCLWEGRSRGPSFGACTDREFVSYSLPIRSSDLTLNMRRVTGSPWIADSVRRWTFPEIVILGAEQKERSLWGWECPIGVNGERRMLELLGGSAAVAPLRIFPIPSILGTWEPFVSSPYFPSRKTNTIIQLLNVHYLFLSTPN